MKNEYVMSERETKMEDLYVRMQESLSAYKKEIEEMYDDEDETLQFNLARINRRVNVILDSLETERSILGRENKNYMFRVTIEFKDELPDEKKKELKVLVAAVFHSLDEYLDDQREDINGCFYESETEEYIARGVLTLQDVFCLAEYCSVWKYVNEEFDSESYDLTEEYFLYDEEENISFL